MSKVVGDWLILPGHGRLAGGIVSSEDRLIQYEYDVRTSAPAERIDREDLADPQVLVPAAGPDLRARQFRIRERCWVCRRNGRGCGSPPVACSMVRLIYAKLPFPA